MQPNELRKVFVEETSSPMTYDYINLVGHSKAMCAKNNGIIKKDELYVHVNKVQEVVSNSNSINWRDHDICNL